MTEKGKMLDNRVFVVFVVFCSKKYRLKEDCRSDVPSDSVICILGGRIQTLSLKCGWLFCHLDCSKNA